MQTPGPINRDIRILPIELDSSADGAAGGGLAETEQTIKHGTVLPNIEALELARVSVVLKRIRSHSGEEIHVVLGVKAADILRSGGEWAANLHPTVERVVDNEIVRHTDAVRLHRVTLAVVIVANRWLVEVGHAPLPRVGA